MDIFFSREANKGFVLELEYVSEVGKNPLLAYTMLQVIDKFQQESCIPPEILAKLEAPPILRNKQRLILSPSRFYRILFLIHKDCEKTGLVLRLPFYWYKSGPVVYGRQAPRVFNVIRVAKTQQVVASFKQWKDTVLIFENSESAYSDAILLTLDVGNLVRRTKLDIIYEYSPSRLHKELITILNELHNILKKGAVHKMDVDALAKLVACMVDEGVEDRYRELRRSFEAVASVVQTELTLGPNMQRVARVFQDIWNVLSLGLRAKENANIDQKQVQAWENKYVVALSAFEHQLSSF
jgi:hypothetical protein